MQTFSSDSSSANNNNSSGSNSKRNESSISHPNIATNTNNSRIYNEAKNQKSLVRASGKNKSLVPYINNILVVPVQKPLFPGFSSMLYLKDENLKSHFIKQYRKRLQAQYNKDNKIQNPKDIINSTEWIGLFLYNHKMSPITAEEELINAENATENTEAQIQKSTPDNAVDAEHTIADKEEQHKIVWHPALDEVNSDMHHFVEALPKDISDVFEYGVLAKIDYNDETTNISEFVKLENEAMALSAEQGGFPLPSGSASMDAVKEEKHQKSKKNRKGVAFPVHRWEDPLVLKVISARRIRLDSISEHQPLLTANIEHLQPEINIKKSDILSSDQLAATEEHKEGSIEVLDDIDVLNENKHIVNESESEIKCRSAFNVASDLLRRLYADDPDNRRDMIQLWSARHHIDIGFFCDFAASITNSTPRELQKLLECVDYGERLELLCSLLKREQKMMSKRDEIMKNVDALIKKEDESHYLKMIMHTTQKRLMINHREKNILTYGPNGSGYKYNGTRESSQGQGQYVEAMDGGEEEKKDRYARLAQKFQERVQNKTMCPEAKEVFDEGIEKLINAKNKESLDVETTKQYLDWISSLPWNYYSVDNDDIKKAREILDDEHFGMKLVKERILEVIACNILRGELNLNEKYGGAQEIEPVEETTDETKKKDEPNESKILCLVGPPGVGKTSIGASIAKGLHRKFFKFSLGGSDDSHLLKGFLRTYAGSQPGKIIYGLKQCGTANPMILIDEIDKMGARHSDPSHALLEILDPSQNHIFSDNYLDFPTDLSKVLFICTANDESKINPVLRDRLHIIRLDGYDEHEKLQIAKKYLLPNALKKCGLKSENICLSDEVIIELIKWYSRESGVRSLQQNIERICYKSALELAEAGITFDDIHHQQQQQTTNDAIAADEIKESEAEIVTNGTNRGKKILETLSSFVKRIASDKTERSSTQTIEINEEAVEEEKQNHEIPFLAITKENLKQYVGLRKYQNERTYTDSKSTPHGVVTGLAYTSNGGCITYVETIKYSQKAKGEKGNGGSIKTTGNLGKVMSESIEIAQCVARAILMNKIDADNTFFDDYNVHLHCPEGGIQKDGPSAGITMVTALLSLALNHSIDPNVAMTGEITLTGRILKIGGLKEKLLAAKRANIDRILLPYDNYDDFYDDTYGVPKYLREEFKDVHFVKNYDEVLDILFSDYLIDTKVYDGFENEFEGGQIDLNKSLEMPKPI